jgi:hypothetical protein
VDVIAHGYLSVIRNAVGITVLLLGISVLYLLVDRWFVEHGRDGRR